MMCKTLSVSDGVECYVEEWYREGDVGEGWSQGSGERTVRASVPHKVSFEQKEVCGDSHGDTWGRTFQAEGAASTKVWRQDSARGLRDAGARRIWSAVCMVYGGRWGWRGKGGGAGPDLEGTE